ncbi:molybdenum cofactor guanylyltransferase MobA [Thiohalophilus sp.]|uniref:molybdenum cofactor guanylyltransferase MobA n=1 Tax=Thiohalophilus sp. TaxID=3028392 RepID=UPI002ACDC8A8|nr:molybdenum cofactor guanylyltransferase MobA [Thiohalophilus sp.]MDZ7802526.1 molybdenum cofactor guanylyltransferase MobA [Thiohalophilus sp.]
MSLSAPTTITGIVLAGGRARRMQGQDKGLLPYQGRPLIEHVCERLRPQVAKLCLNANRHREIYQRYGYPVIEDMWPDFPGPLAGFYSALQQCAGEWFCFVPCDTPQLPTDLVARLRETATKAQVPVVAVTDGEHLHGTLCLLHRSCESALLSYYQQGHHRVQEWIRSQSYALVDYGDQSQALININEPQQLEPGLS